MQEQIICKANVTEEDDAVKSVSNALHLAARLLTTSLPATWISTPINPRSAAKYLLLSQVSQVRALIVEPRPPLFDANDPRHFNCLPMSLYVLTTIMKNDLSLATQRYHSVPTNTKGLLMLGRHAARFYHFCLQPAERRFHVATDGNHPILNVGCRNSTVVLDFFHPAPAAKQVVLVRKQYVALKAAYKELECTLQLGER